MSIATKCICGASTYCIGAPGICPNAEKPKPIKARPVFYAWCLNTLQEIAMGCGYNLIAHGSLNRDFDLIAVPWTEEPESHYDLLCKMDMWLNGVYQSELSGYHPGKPRAGRISYHINLNRGNKWNQYLDEQWYLDISFTPLVKDA